MKRMGAEKALVTFKIAAVEEFVFFFFLLKKRKIFSALGQFS